MAFWRGHRVKAPPAARPARDPAVYGVMLSEEENFNALPFGGHAGELLPAAAAVTERAPPPQPLQIEPPPWAGQMGDVAIVQPELPAPTALAVMKLQGGDIEEPPPPPLRAPLVMPPLVRPQLPEPDWRAEEQERLARKRMQPATDEPAKSLQGRPLEPAGSWRAGHRFRWNTRSYFSPDPRDFWSPVKHRIWQVDPDKLRHVQGPISPCGPAIGCRGERVLCESCRERAIEAEARREHSRVVGSQPAVCHWCKRPFEATRLGHRFCSPAHRAAAWRTVAPKA